MHDELLDGTRAADRRVPVRERLSGVRRADRQHRSARENGGAAHPRPAAANARRISMAARGSRRLQRSSRLSSLADRHARDRQLQPATGSVPRAPTPRCRVAIRSPPRSCRSRSLGGARRDMAVSAASSSSAAASRRRVTVTTTVGDHRRRASPRRRRGARCSAGGAPARAPFVFFDLETTGLERRRRHATRFWSAAAGSTRTARSSRGSSC